MPFNKNRMKRGNMRFKLKYFFIVICSIGFSYVLLWYAGGIWAKKVFRNLYNTQVIVELNKINPVPDQIKINPLKESELTVSGFPFGWKIEFNPVSFFVLKDVPSGNIEKILSRIKKYSCYMQTNFMELMQSTFKIKFAIDVDMPTEIDPVTMMTRIEMRYDPFKKTFFPESAFQFHFVYQQAKKDKDIATVALQWNFNRKKEYIFGETDISMHLYPSFHRIIHEFINKADPQQEYLGQQIKQFLPLKIEQEFQISYPEKCFNMKYGIDFFKKCRPLYINLKTLSVQMHTLPSIQITGQGEFLAGSAL